MNAASLGVALVGFSCLRVLSGISIWYILLPGYLLAFILSFFIPKSSLRLLSTPSIGHGRDDRDFLIPLRMRPQEKSKARMS